MLILSCDLALIGGAHSQLPNVQQQLSCIMKLVEALEGMKVRVHDPSVSHNKMT